MMALDRLLARLPDGLIDDNARKRLRLIGDELPDALGERLGLQIRLDREDRVDLQVVAATERQLGALTAAGMAARDGSGRGPGSAWRATGRLAERSLALIRYADPLPSPIRLEFDAGSDHCELPAPGAFVGAAPEPGTPGAARWDVSTTVAEILGAATPGGPARGLVAAVDRVVASDLSVRQVGCHPGRPADTVRLVCAVASPYAALDSLARCGWRGPAETLASWVLSCAEWAELLRIDIDVTPYGVRPAVAIEVASRPAHPYPHWAGLLAMLCDEGLCTPRKRDALSADADADALHHVSITVTGDRKLAATAYYGAYEAA